MSTDAAATNRLESMGLLLRALKLPGFAQHAEQVAQTAEREGWSYGQFLHHLAELEVEERRARRVEKYLKESRLPAEKTLATLDRSLLPGRVQKLMAALCSGDFIGRAENVLAFGLPGRGKTHLLCGIGHELIQRGHRVLFTPAYVLVQHLLAAKRDLRLEKHLTHLDRYDVVLLDDIGYV